MDGQRILRKLCLKFSQFISLHKASKFPSDTSHSLLVHSRRFELSDLAQETIDSLATIVYSMSSCYAKRIHLNCVFASSGEELELKECTIERPEFADQRLVLRCRATTVVESRDEVFDQEGNGYDVPYASACYWHF